MKIFLAFAAWGLWLTGRPGWSILAGLSMVVIYAVQAVAFPFGHCWACNGNGRWYRNGRRRNFRDCWWCGGAGRRKRIVRRVYDRFRSVEKKAS